MKNNTYQVVNKFICYGKKMVVVKMKKAVCVMEMDEYKTMIKEETESFIDIIRSA